MSGRHAEQHGLQLRARWLVPAAASLVAALSLLVLTPAGAAATTVNAQFTLTGVATGDSPVGGSVIGIHPGDKVTFKTSALPTAGLDKLGLGDLVGGLLGGVIGYKSVADFHGLPGGKVNTAVDTKTAASFTFPKKGTYNFTFSLKKITLLGTLDLDLTGNQAAAAGVKLNADNQYVGKIVVADNPPKGGIALQLPKVSVQPKVGPIQLPKIGLPGVNTPTLPVSVPDLLPNKPKANTPPASKPDSGLGAYVPPGLSVPQLVMPQNAGDTVSGGGGYVGGGYYNGVLPDSNSQVGNVSSPQISGNSNDLAIAPEPGATKQSSTGKDKTIDLASKADKSSSQLPVLLAIIAIIALALVAGTYARLFLMGKKP